MKWLTNIIYFLNTTAFAGDNATNNNTDANATVGPIYEFLDTFGPALIAILLGVGSLYCIILGVQYAKAEKGEERDTAKKKAVNAAISFGVIIILIIFLYAFRGTFIDLLSD